MKNVLLFISALWLFGCASTTLRPQHLYLAGDSTMAEKLPEKRPETGWGEELQHAFKPQMQVVNLAKNGRSTRTFISEGRWQSLVAALQSGDWVFIQFGHNDESKEKVDRYTAPDAFRQNLERFVAEVRAKGANPVLLTPVMRRRFDDNGQFYDVHGVYPDITRGVAMDKKVPLLDMHRRSEAVLVKLGAEPSRALFLQLKPGQNPNYPKGVEDNTHFNPKGAEAMNALAVAAIREQLPALAAYLK